VLFGHVTLCITQLPHARQPNSLFPCPFSSRPRHLPTYLPQDLTHSYTHTWLVVWSGRVVLRIPLTIGLLALSRREVG